jgi:hypothetical protein
MVETKAFKMDGGSCIKAARESCCPLMEVGSRDAEPLGLTSRRWSVTNSLGRFRYPALERIQRARRAFVQQRPWRPAAASEG